MRPRWLLIATLAACAPAIPDDVSETGAVVPPKAETAAVSSGSGASVAPADPAEALSDEQSFEAVTDRETIESDRERLKRMQAAYELITPDELPALDPRGAGPNIVEYALRTDNTPGEQVYRRLNPLRWRRSETACAAFAAPDQAQIAFLEKGGPERDPAHLDPDGDGFACGWDPEAFRKAARRSRGELRPAGIRALAGGTR